MMGQQAAMSLTGPARLRRALGGQAAQMATGACGTGRVQSWSVCVADAAKIRVQSRLRNTGAGQDAIDAGSVNLRFIEGEWKI